MNKKMKAHDSSKLVPCTLTFEAMVSSGQVNTMHTPKSARLVMSYEHGDVVLPLNTIGFKFESEK